MGSQTLEILRQGFLASLTGGWFFDPSHKTTFANAVHLYIYLFLLCTPFVTYMVSQSPPRRPHFLFYDLHFSTLLLAPTQYSPATLTAWIVYCSFVVVLMGALKVINLNMHGMYDRAQILSDPKAPSHKTATVGYVEH